MEVPGSKDPGPQPAQPKPRRSFTARLLHLVGLEGKIVIAMMALLTVALGSTCWLWKARIDTQVIGILGEQARQTAVTLSMAARPAMASGDSDSLCTMGKALLRARNVQFVAFYDGKGNNIAVADGFANPPPWAPLQGNDISSLGQISHGTSQFGEYLAVTEPVLVQVASGVRRSRLVGYVCVGISPMQEHLQVERVKYLATGIGCVVILGILPLAYLLVHRIFLPIRELVSATNRISAGDLEHTVAIDRPDAIGELARAFNAMVATIKEHQLQLHDANTALEEKVQLRTAQLEAANRRLSSEIAEKEDFLRAISHDLNAPLRNISGMTSMLLMKHAENFNEEIVHRLQRIQKNVEAETQLISELLEISRIKTRREKMEMVELGPLVRELEEILENDLRSGNIQMTIDTPLPVINGERSRFRQVFQNLIDNAIKYMGDGSAREIHIGCDVRPMETEFYVRDTGMGIDPEDVDKVFYIFRRGKNSATCNVPGKGVGLSCVKSIIETYSGSIWVESEVGKGSTFRFTINGQFVCGSPAGEMKASSGA